ncbi:MAG: PAS domain-containing protein [Fuerstiella sp.]
MMPHKLPAAASVATDTRRLNVLIVEDRPTDAELLVRELRHSGFDVAWKRVATKTDYCLALEDTYDLVLADYSLPQFDGLEALDLLRTRKLNTPFILISGVVGEETAVRAIKHGAQDYLLKDRLARLGPAVVQALDNKELEEEVLRSEVERNALVQQLRNRISELSCLQHVFHVTGDDEKSEDEIFQNVVDALPQGFRYPELAAARLTVDGREFLSPAFEKIPHPLVVQFETDGGQQGVIEVVYLAPLPGDNDELYLPEERQLVNTVSKLLHRCLDRRYAARTLTRDALVLANVQDAAIVTDTEGIVTFWNEGATRLFGWTADEMIGRHYADRYSEEVRPWIRAQIRERLAGEPWIGEYEDLRKDGSHVWIDARVTRVLDDDGHVAGVLGISRDITARKLAEAEIRASETRYRNIVESSHDLIWSVDAEGTITYMNQASRWIYGRDATEMIGKPFYEFVPPGQREKDAAFFAETMQTGAKTVGYQSQVFRKDGSIVSLSCNATIARDENGEVTGASGISRDMSELHEANLSLRRRETLLANAERIAEIGSWEYDIPRDRLEWSPNTLRIFGITEDEFEGNLAAFLQRIHPEDRDRELRAIALADAGNRLMESEYRIIRTAGDERIIRERGEVSFDVTGKAVRRTGVILDITKDVRNLEALRKSEERFEMAVRGSAAGLWDWDMLTNNVFYSGRFKELLGYEEHEFLPEFASFYDALHPEDRGRVDDALNEHFRRGRTYDIDYRLRTKAGEYRWFQARGSVLRDDSGQPFRMAGSLVDITSQKRLEQDLTERERRQRELVSQLQEEKRRLAEAQAVAKVGSWETDIATSKVVWSDETHRIFGVDPGSLELTHDLFLDFVHPNDRQSVADAFNASLHHCEVCRIEHRILLHDNQLKVVEETWRCFQDQHGTPVRAVGTCRDITASRKADEDLAAHAKRLETISVIGRSLLEIRDLPSALSACADAVNSNMDGVVTRIWLTNDESQVLRLESSTGEQLSGMEEMAPTFSNHPVATAAREKQSVLLNAAEHGPLFPEHEGKFTSHAAIPLVDEEDCPGVLEVLSKSHLTDDERVGLEIIASSLALSIDRIRSEEALRSLNAQLEQRVHERTQELSESSRRHEMLLSNLQGMAYRCRLDEAWTLEYVSSGCRVLMGVDAGELIGKSLRYAGLIHPDDRTAVAESCKAALAAGRPIHEDYRIVPPHGAIKWVWEQARGVYDCDGNIEGIEGFITDITASKLAALREKNQSRFYELLTSGASLTTCLKQIVHSAESENPSLTCFALLLDDAKTTLSLAAGSGLPETLRKALKSIPVRVEGDRLTFVVEENSHFKPHQQPADVDREPLRIVGVSGVRSHLSVAIRSIEESVVLGTFNICGFNSEALTDRDAERIRWAADLTNLAIQHTRAKKALVDSVSFTQTTLDAISVHIAVLDSTGRIVKTNKAWRQFAADHDGSEAACCEGANYFSACHGSDGKDSEDPRRVVSGLRAILRGEKQEWQSEYPCQLGTETYWYQMHARGFKINEETHCLVAHENITAIKRTEAELRQTADAAEQANLAKSQFLATMSHELRTPLNGILGMNELLTTTGLTDQQSNYVAASTASGRHLAQLIDDILDLSRIEAGKLELNVCECDLGSLLDEVIGSMRSLIEKKQLVFNVELAPECRDVILCDAHRLRQILINLIGNATKFTSEGSVTLQGSRVTDAQGKEFQFFSVIDTGIGIPKERQDRLFKPFSQVDSSTTRQFGGTGLGLSICLQLVSLMGGRIGVQSGDGVGSTFWFEFPVEVIKSSTDRTSATSVDPKSRLGNQPTPIGLLRGHLLVAEDNEINQLYMQELLTTLGFTVKIVADGRQALESVFRESFDAVLMDCQMPEIDGFTAAREIRKREVAEGRASPIPIIALTANALRGDRERCLQAGMNDYLSKPAEIDRIVQVLQAFIVPASGSPPTEASE